jgi:hypothetical protein
MAESTFDRETLLDLTVNIVPLGILTFFILVFLFVSPWELDPFVTAISMGLLIVPFTVLALVTFVSGRAVARDEESGSTAGELSASNATLDSGVEGELTSDDTSESDNGEDDEDHGGNESRENDEDDAESNESDSGGDDDAGDENDTN